jgi:UDP-3-O-[3-hydroxymyristoyl] N-acetylglucosamine deacetylase
MQHTLNSAITIRGTGLHSGRTVRVHIAPAAGDSGIVFRRSDIVNADCDVPARRNNVVDTRMCTVIANDNDVRIATIEHLMAALRACGIDNALISLDAGEVPVLDGSARGFYDAIIQAGRLVQNAPRRAIKIVRPVSVSAPGRNASLRPAVGAKYTASIDFNHPVIGQQSCSIDLVNGAFDIQIADARTFGFLSEVHALQAQGLALGGSLDNAIVLDDSTVLNEEGLRFGDEFARHKVLDAIGDLYLAGGPIIGAYSGNCAGHSLNNALLHKLYATPDAWQAVDIYSDIEVPRGDQRLIVAGDTQRAVALA